MRRDNCASRRVSRSGEDLARGPPEAMLGAADAWAATSGSALGVGSDMPRAWLTASPLQSGLRQVRCPRRGAAAWQHVNTHQQV